MPLQSLDIRNRSATTFTPPSARQTMELAKLIDVSRCIGCKACQAACMEWNDLRQDIGYFEGSYDNPGDLSPATWTLMRFTEWEDPKGNLEWLIRKDGCMHCEDPGCLKACPAPGAIVQYSNGIVDFVHENCIGCGYCVKGCPFNIPRISRVDNTAYKCTLCSDRAAVGQEPACAKACPTELPLLQALLPRSSTPVQIVCGRRDRVVPLPNTENLHTRLPRNRLDILEAGSLHLRGGERSVRLGRHFLMACPVPNGHEEL